MTITVKRRPDSVAPTRVRLPAGFRAGDEVEYNPERRRVMDAQLDEAEKGLFHGPFNTADEMIAHLKVNLKTRATTKNNQTVS